MRKFYAVLLSLTVILSSTFTFSTLPVSASTYDATVTFYDTTPNTTPLNVGMAGYNLMNMKSGYNYNDQNFIDQVKDLNPGHLRWPGGTTADAYNWREGRMDPEAVGQMYKGYNGDGYYNFTTDLMEDIEGTVYQNLMEFKKLADAAGSKIIIAINGFTDTTSSIGQLAKFCKDNNIKVEYYELCNEPYEFLKNDNPRYFTDGYDYAAKMQPYNDAIKANDATAKTAIFCENKTDGTFNDGIKSYMQANSRYWDAACFHLYHGTGSTAQAQYDSANSVLDDEIPQIIAELQDTNGSDIPIINTETNLPPGTLLRSTLYDAIFAAEYLARMSVYSNVKYMGIQQVVDASIEATNSAQADIMSAYENGTQFDTNGYDFGFYKMSTGLATALANEAINYSTDAFQTTVSGSQSVTKSGGTMDALHAQTYKGFEGKRYVLITNKSADTYNITINKNNGGSVNSTKTVKFITNTDYTVDNSASDTSLISINTETAGSTVNIRPYSVTLVTWDNPDAPNLAPQIPPMLLSARTQSDGTSIAVNWVSVPLSTNYDVKYGTSSGNYTSTVNVTGGDATTATISGLSLATKYYFVVVAKNANGQSADSNEVCEKSGLPAPVTNITAISKQNSIQLTWDSMPCASGYRVKYGTTSGSYPTVIDVGNQTGYTIYNLTPGTTYYIVVQAYNPFGNGRAPSEITAVPRAKTSYSPNNLQVSSSTDTSATLTWDRTPFTKVFDAFQDGDANGWTAVSGTWSVADKNGSLQYYISRLAGNDVTVLNNSPTQYDLDVTYTTDTWNTNSKLGLVCRYIDANNYYRFIWDKTDGAYKLIKRENGTDTVLASSTEGKFNSANMSVRVYNNKIEGYVNRVLKVSATGLTQASGKMGLYANDINAWFDFIYLNDKTSSSFNVYRSTSPDTDYSLITTSNGNTFTDTGLTGGVTYYYRATSTDADGNESIIPSNVATK